MTRWVAHTLTQQARIAVRHAYLRLRIEQPGKHRKIADRVHRLKVGQHFDVRGVGTDERSRNRFRSGLYASGGEGMVIKPLEFVTKGRKGLAQPAVKVRGREYLRIIYGPEYTLPENLERLKSRGLGTKRSLALREFALGLEALERFVHKEPLRRVHECVFGVLALESEPVDPRL